MTCCACNDVVMTWDKYLAMIVMAPVGIFSVCLLYYGMYMLIKEWWTER